VKSAFDGAKAENASRNGGSLVPRSLFYLLVKGPTILRSEGGRSNLSSSAMKFDPKKPASRLPAIALDHLLYSTYKSEQWSNGEADQS
jgi:hypothetical protein